MKILGIAGGNRAGKSTLADYVMGQQLCRMGITDQFHIGDILQIAGDSINEKGEYQGKVLGELDHRNVYKIKELNNWLEANVWPTIKVYSHATPLKNACMDIFGLTIEQCYGAEKNCPSKVTRQIGRAHV